MIGIYLLGVGVFAKVSVYLGISELLSETASIVFMALLGMAVMLLSDKIRYGISEISFISI